MTRLIRRVALAAALACFAVAGGCSQVGSWLGQGDREIANPLGEADLVDTKVLASYGLVTIALEEAAIIAENPATPDRVVLAISRAAPAVLASANVARTAAVEYRYARIAYESAQAAGGNDTATLMLALTQAGLRLNAAVASLKADLDVLRRALGRSESQALTEANARLEGAEVPQE